MSWRRRRRADAPPEGPAAVTPDPPSPEETPTLGGRPPWSEAEIEELRAAVEERRPAGQDDDRASQNDDGSAGQDGDRAGQDGDRARAGRA